MIRVDAFSCTFKGIIESRLINRRQPLNFTQHIAVYMGLTVQNRFISYLSRNGINSKSSVGQGGGGELILACTTRQYDSCSI